MSYFYTGKCKGGPQDGQMMCHYAKSKEFFSPVLGGLTLNENTPIVPVKIGEYYYAAHNYWQWAPTKEGKALATIRDIEPH